MVAAQCFCIGGRERERPLERWEWGRFTPDEEEEERGLRYSKSECLKIYKDFSPIFVPLISIQGQMKIVDRGIPNPLLSQMSKYRAL